MGLRLAALGLIFGTLAATARSGSWELRAEPTLESSKELMALLDTLQSSTIGERAAFRVENVTVTAQDFELVLTQGTLTQESDVQGKPGGFWFTGDALVSFMPENRRAKTSMKWWFGNEALAKVPIRRAYIRGYGRPPVAEPATPGASVEAIAPAELAQYADVKSSLKMRGLDGLRLFLNSEGRSKGALEVVFVMDSIRVPGGDESLLRYVWDPGERYAVALELFGHPRMTDHPEWKYLYRQLAAEKAKGATFVPEAAVSEYAAKMRISSKGSENKETATLQLTPNEGTKSLTLDFTLALKVLSVTDGQGRALAFAQWKEGAHAIDSSLVVRLPDDAKAGEPMTIVVESEGELFQSWYGWYYMKEEDNWIPRVRETPPSIYDVEVTVNKKYTVVGAGVAGETKDEGDLRTFHFRTPMPADISSLHYGELKASTVKADEVTVEAYANIASVEESKQRDFVANEIANAVKIYNRILGPVGLPVLRVVSTPTAHGRGFQGIILIGSGFGDTSFTDVYRAHEVAHQWWGNIAMPEDWAEERWLGETFAEYSSMEFYQVRYQDRKKTLELMDRTWMKPLIDPLAVKHKLLDNTEAVDQCAACQPVVLGTQNVYTKGPMVLHMLRALIRKRMGSDAMFWDILRTFLKENDHEQVTTQDFTALVERKLGMKLDWFWEQWLYRAETPVVKWKWSKAQEGGQWKITLDAKQENTSFRLLIPATVTLSNGQAGNVDLEMGGKTGQVSVTLPAEPKKVELNAARDCLVRLIEEK